MFEIYLYLIFISNQNTRQSWYGFSITRNILQKMTVFYLVIDVTLLINPSEWVSFMLSCVFSIESFLADINCLLPQL